MTRSRQTFASLTLAVVAAFAAGCGNSGGGSPKPVTTPGATASAGTGATPGSTTTPQSAGTAPAVGAPSPVSTTVGTAQTVTTRPLASGDSYTYAGTLVTTFVFYGSSPMPMTTAQAAVTQTVTLSGPVTHGGVSNLTDVDTAETDTSALATKTVTSDAYEALATVAGGQQLTLSSSSSTTSDGYTIGIAYPNPYVLDVLPETAGATFANSPAQTISETEPGGYASSRTYASDGTYSDTETYPAQAGGGGTTPSATIIEYRQGNGMYSLPLQGYSANTIVTIGSPSPVSTAGASTIPLTLQVPDPTVSPQSVTVPTWYAQPLALYRETNLQTGSKSLPGACGVPAAIATAGNALVSEIERVDTVLGVDETSTEIAYVAPTYGLVCTQLTDVAKSYYDFSGQTLDGIALADATGPLEVDTVAETVGMTAAKKSASEARAVPASALRGGAARGAFEIAVARARDARVRRALGALELRLRRAAR